MSEHTDFSGMENEPYTAKVVLSLIPHRKAKKGTVKKFRGGLVKMFPELKDLTDEELRKLVE